MRARRVFPLLLVLAGVALVASGCFSSKVADTTIANDITIGQGTTAKTVSPTTSGVGSTTTSSTSTGTTGTATTGGTKTGGTTTTGGSTADLAAGKTAFTATCGGCHVLKAAGTNGQVGPSLDSFGPLSVALVANQIAKGGQIMPPKLLTGQDAANVAAYVASVAGK